VRQCYWLAGCQDSVKCTQFSIANSLCLVLLRWHLWWYMLLATLQRADTSAISTQLKTRRTAYTCTCTFRWWVVASTLYRAYCLHVFIYSVNWGCNWECLRNINHATLWVYTLWPLCECDSSAYTSESSDTDNINTANYVTFLLEYALPLACRSSEGLEVSTVSVLLTTCVQCCSNTIDVDTHCWQKRELHLTCKPLPPLHAVK
jgi:hypothetical protein